MFFIELLCEIVRSESGILSLSTSGDSDDVVTQLLLYLLTLRLVDHLYHLDTFATRSDSDSP